MDDPQTDALLRQLRSQDPHEAWAKFLELYSPLLLGVVRFFEWNEDAIADCYVFVCEHLCHDNFRKLRRFRPDGPARFATWLRAVARNLCLDWHRREVGRQRLFKSIGRMPALEQEIFRCLFIELLAAENLFPRLRRRFPALAATEAREAVERVEQALTSRQRWLLAVRRDRALLGAVSAGASDDGDLLRIPSGQPDPETWTGLQEERRALLRAMAALTPGERVLLQLRFSRQLTLDKIAQVLDLNGPQGADRRIRETVKKLRERMRGRDGKLPLTSV